MRAESVSESVERSVRLGIRHHEYTLFEAVVELDLFSTLKGDSQ